MNKQAIHLLSPKLLLVNFTHCQAHHPHGAGNAVGEIIYMHTLIQCGIQRLQGVQAPKPRIAQILGPGCWEGHTMQGLNSRTEAATIGRGLAR